MTVAVSVAVAVGGITVSVASVNCVGSAVAVTNPPRF